MVGITSGVTTITRIFPEITIVSIIAGLIIFLILLPFLALMWGNLTVIGQIIAFISGLWIAAKFVG